MTGVGTFFPPHLRQNLGQQFAQHLGRIHAFAWQQSELDAFDKPQLGTQSVEWDLNHWERIWEDVKGSESSKRVAGVLPRTRDAGAAFQS